MVSMYALGISERTSFKHVLAQLRFLLFPPLAIPPLTDTLRLHPVSWVRIRSPLALTSLTDTLHLHSVSWVCIRTPLALPSLTDTLHLHPVSWVCIRYPRKGIAQCGWAFQAVVAPGKPNPTQSAHVFLWYLS